MAYTNQLLYEPLRSIDSATFTGSFLPLGTPLLHPSALIKIVNTSSVLVTISIDGVTAVDVVPANGFVLYDVTSDSPPQASNGIFVPQHRQYYVSGTASTGLVYLVVQYISQV
jgi:hypothetical protein